MVLNFEFLGLTNNIIVAYYNVNIITLLVV